MAPVHPFDEALSLVPIEQGDASTEVGALRRWSGRTHAGYQNMVGPYGGMIAAQALQAVLLHPDRLGEPVSLTVNFAAAWSEGAFVAEARASRTNRSTQHWDVTLTQADASGVQRVLVTATAITALRRTTWGASELGLPAAPRPESLPRAPFTGRTTWFQRYDMRVCAGDFPSAWDGASRDSLTQLWVRDDPPRPLDFASLAAQCDVFYPRIWLRRATLTPAGTVSMTVYFHADAAALAASGTGFLFAQARAKCFFHGFFDQSAEVWSEAGVLLATSHQVVYFKQ